MGALKPRAGSGDLEVCREARHVLILIPTDERAERVVFTMDDPEAWDLAMKLADATSRDE